MSSGKSKQQPKTASATPAPAAASASKKQTTSAPTVTAPVVVAPAPKSEKTLLTEKVGLSLNVNAFRSWTKRYLENTGLTVVQKGGEGKPDVNVVPRLTGIHIALTAVAEVLCTELLNITIKRTERDKSGLYSITSNTLRYAFMLDDDLEHLCNRFLKTFNPTMDYSNQFCISKKDVMTFVENKFGKNVDIDSSGYNLLAYLLSSVLIDFTCTSYLLMNYAGRKSLDFNVVRTVVKLRCSGLIENAMNRAIEDCEKLYTPEQQETQEVQEGESDQQEVATSSRNKKQSASVAAEIEAESVEDESVEEEVEATPAPPAVSAKSNTKNTVQKVRSNSSK